jgi:hypothetical protein
VLLFQLLKFSFASIFAETKLADGAMDYPRVRALYMFADRSAMALFEIIVALTGPYRSCAMSSLYRDGVYRSAEHGRRGDKAVPISSGAVYSSPISSALQMVAMADCPT